MSLPKPVDRRLAIAAWVLWGVYVLVLATLAYRHYPKHTVTDNYRRPAQLWWAGVNIYPVPAQPSGFLYFPQSALLFSPLAALPVRLAEAVWRLIGGGLLGLGIYRLARVCGGKAWPGAFLLIVVGCLAPGAGAMQNGQMNVPMAALMLLATVDLVKQRWDRATVLLILALALKPLALVLLLLVAAIYPARMSWRLAVGVLVMLMFPFIAQPFVYPFNPDYVLMQYDLCVRTMMAAGKISPLHYPDLGGMLHAWGVPTPEKTMLAIRAGAAVVTLGLAWLARRRWGRAWGPVLVLTFAATYLMLFNPRTEGNSYIILAPLVALLAASALLLERRSIAGVALLVMLVGLGFSEEVRRGNVWLRPALTCLFLLYLAYLALVGRPPAMAPDAPTAYRGTDQAHG